MSKPRTDRNIRIPDYALKLLLTSSEVRMIKNRFRIVNLLEDGLSIRDIARRVKVGTDTVVRVASMIEKSSRPTRKIITNTPWIFGKSG